MTVGSVPAVEMYVLGGGWCLVVDDRRSRVAAESSELGQRRMPMLGLQVRFADRAGRLEVVELHWLKASSEGAITGEDLRAVRLGQIEASANSPRIAEKIRESLGHDQELKWSQPAITAGHLVERLAKLVADRPRKKLRVPEGRGKYPDSFYDLVGSLYVLAASRSQPPAPFIAEMAEVPVSTVHRWIREARRRGFLAPSKRRKASDA
jgi:hypothetical protein